MLQIKTLRETSLDDVLRLYNEGIAQNPHSGRLDRQTWQRTIAAKPYYRDDDVLVAYESSRPVGYVHLCHAPNQDRTAPDPTKGSIEALFFDPRRPAVGRALLEAALERHRAAGAREVLGWSTFSGYPLYRGIFVGLEPMAMDKDTHIVQAFLDSGFEYCQHSVLMAVNYDQPVAEQRPVIDIDFVVGVWQPPTQWDTATWIGLEPYRCQAFVDGREAGACVYALMPIISATYGVPVACIASLHTNPDFRRQGIGAFLVARALNHMLDLGARRLMLGTQHDNVAAHATYHHGGMKIEDHVRGFALHFSHEQVG